MDRKRIEELGEEYEGTADFMTYHDPVNLVEDAVRRIEEQIRDKYNCDPAKFPEVVDQGVIAYLDALRYPSDYVYEVMTDGAFNASEDELGEIMNERGIGLK